MVRELDEWQSKDYRGAFPLEVKALLPHVAFQGYSQRIATTYEIIKENQSKGIFHTAKGATFLHLNTPLALCEYWGEIKPFTEGLLLVDKSKLTDLAALNFLQEFPYMEKELHGSEKNVLTQQESLYHLLKDAFGIMRSWEEDFEFGSYYANTHHCIRHGYCKVHNLYKEGKAVATASVLWIQKDYGFIQNVAVLKGEQHKGYGREVVEELCRAVDLKKAGLFCDGENLLFYEKLGFARKGVICSVLL